MAYNNLRRNFRGMRASNDSSRPSSGGGGRWPAANQWGVYEDQEDEFGQFGYDFNDQDWFDRQNFSQYYNSPQGAEDKNNVGFARSAADQYRRGGSYGGQVDPKGRPIDNSGSKWAWLDGATESSIGGFDPVPTTSYEDVMKQLQGGSRSGGSTEPDWVKAKREREEKIAAGGGTGEVTGGGQINSLAEESRTLTEWWNNATDDQAYRSGPHGDIAPNMDGADKETVAKHVNSLNDKIASLRASGSGSSGAGPGPETQFSRPNAPDASYGMVADVMSTLPQVGNQYRKIANEGVYGESGMKNVLDPMEQSQDMILQRLGPYLQMMLGISDKQTSSAQDQNRVLGAETRRRAEAGMSDEIARMGGSMPGVAARTSAEAMMPFYQDQARNSYGINMDRLAKEENLRAGNEDTYRNIVSDRGAMRSGLIDKNLLSKSGGLEGLQDLLNQEASIASSGIHDLEDPMSKQYDYSSSMANLGQYFGDQNAFRDFRNSVSMLGYQTDAQKELMQFGADLNDQEWWEDMVAILMQGASTMRREGGQAATAAGGGVPV